MKKSINKKYIPVGIGVVAVILLIGAIFLFSFNGNAVDKTIIHQYFNFSINSNWQETSYESSFIYTPSANKNGESITITSTSLGGITFDLSLPLQQFLEGLKIQMPDLLVSKSGDWDNGKIFGKEVEFTGTKQGMKINGDQIFAIKNGILYSITYSCTDICKYPDAFSKVKETFESLI